MKLLQLINAERALGTLGNTKGLSSITAYRISKNIKSILEEIKTYNDTRTKMCEEYADKAKDGKPIIKDNKYIMSTLEDINKAGLSPLELDSIEFMLDFEEEK